MMDTLPEMDKPRTPYILAPLPVTDTPKSSEALSKADREKARFRMGLKEDQKGKLKGLNL